MRCTVVSTFCWTSEPDVSSNPLVLVPKQKIIQDMETDLYYFAYFAHILQRSKKTLTLTAGFTNLPWVAGAAAEGRLEVVDGLLKDLPFPALVEVNS